MVTTNQSICTDCAGTTLATMKGKKEKRAVHDHDPGEYDLAQHGLGQETVPHILEEGRNLMNITEYDATVKARKTVSSGVSVYKLTVFPFS